MKTFEQLTKDEQVTAIQFAKTTIEESLALGIYETNRKISKSEIDKLAIIAAEESTYDDKGRAVMGDNVHPYYLGGCV